MIFSRLWLDQIGMYVNLRGVIVRLAYERAFRPKTLRPLVCRTLQGRQDKYNWAGYPSIDNEVRAQGCSRAGLGGLRRAWHALRLG